MGKAEENKKQKRGSLLQNAYTLFIEKGISNTSIADIALKAGVGKGTFYSYFTDKNDLIDKLIAQKAETLLAHALDELKNHEVAGIVLSAEDKIVLIADSIITALSKDIRLCRFLGKNLSYGFYKKAYTREDFIGNIDIMAKYSEIITSDGSKWKDQDLMLYSLVEFISSTCHSVIIKKEPVDLETYKPIMFSCIRNIMQVFKIN